MESRPPISPKLAIPFGILAVSTSSIFIRYAQADMASIVIAAGRLSIAGAILAVLVAWRHRAEIRALTLRELLLALLSGFFLSLHFATWITSLEYTSVASSVVLVSTAPLWVALLAPLTIKEPVRRVVVLGMGLALLGGTIVGLSDSCTLGGGSLQCPPFSDFVAGEAFTGDLLALAGALAGAGYLLIGRRLREGISLVPYIFLVYGVAAIFLLGYMLIAGETLAGHPPRAYLWLLLLALVPQLLGHSTFNWALRYLSAAFVSITLLGEPIGSAVLAYFLLGETPSLMMGFGAILILAGIWVAGSR
ncbi:MAG: DMT family transporter [Chloroflexi bacterium]|jgi:drug/metabolite transporter (DMT)-like permease|nr:DMT family transporter [Chloroflexota bacterium]